MSETKSDAKSETKTETKEVVESLSMDDEETGTLKLRSKDDKVCEVERKHAFISILVKTSIENEKTAAEVPIPGVNKAILDKVIEYMDHHKGTEPPIIEKPLRSKVMKDVCKDPWDADYIDKIGENRQDLYDLILVRLLVVWLLLHDPI